MLIYYILGGKSILHDLLYKRYNRVELKRKPNHVAIVTGGGRGIGLQVVKMLMECDMHVIIGCRNVKDGEKEAEKLRKEVSTGRVEVLELDLKSLKSVNRFAVSFNERHEYLNLLVNNAGIMFVPYEETEDGFESHFAVNYLGHFLLSHLVLPAMKRASAITNTNSRIINVSSCAHEVAPKIDFSDINMRKFYISQAAYSQSKLCQLMFSKTFDRKLKEQKSNIQVIAVHPGVVDTELFNGTMVKITAPWVLKIFCKNPKQGATTVVYCCIDDRLENAGGSYFSNCCLVPSISYANDIKTQEKLYDLSLQLVKSHLNKSD